MKKKLNNEENVQMNETTNEAPITETEVKETKVRKANPIFKTVRPLLKGITKNATAFVKAVIDKKSAKDDIKKLEVIINQANEEIEKLMNTATLAMKFSTLTADQKEMLKEMLNNEENN